MKRKTRRLPKDFFNSAVKSVGGWRSIAAAGTIISALSVAGGALYYNSIKDYKNVTPENHFLDIPTAGEQPDIIGDQPAQTKSAYKDDRRVHATYRNNPDYQAIGYLWVLNSDNQPVNRCTAEIVEIPGYKNKDNKAIITTIDHCIPSQLQNISLVYSAQFRGANGKRQAFTSPVSTDTITSLPDYNPKQRRFWSNTKQAQSASFAVLDKRPPSFVKPLKISTGWNPVNGQEIIAVGGSSDRYGITIDNKCITKGSVSKFDYSVQTTCQGTPGISGGPVFDAREPNTIVAIINKADAFAKQGDGTSVAVAFPSPAEFDYNSIPWMKKVSPHP